MDENGNAKPIMPKVNPKWKIEFKKNERFAASDCRGAGANVLVCSLCDKDNERYIARIDQEPMMCRDCHKVFCRDCLEKRIYDNVNGEGHKCPNCDKGKKADDENRHNKNEQREIIWLQYTNLNTYLKRILNSLVVRCKQPIGDEKTCGKAFKLKNRKKHYRYKCSAFIYYECTAKICRIRN